VSFHGGGQTAALQSALDLLTTPYFNTDHILVYPQALQSGKAGDYYWQGTPDVKSDDVGYTMEILDALEKKLCLDTSRIYATGKSQGGGFNGVLACNSTATKRFAAFAPVSGAFYIDTEDCSDPETVKIKNCDVGRSKVGSPQHHGQGLGSLN
jgi:poly(3-hydroxybutyrate) depolymerase